MGYIGPIPTQVPLTSSDIADGIISKSKLTTSVGGFNNWESKSASFTAEVGKAYFCDTSGGAIDVTLPAGAVQKDTLRFMDANGTFE